MAVSLKENNCFFVTDQTPRQPFLKWQICVFPISNILTLEFASSQPEIDLRTCFSNKRIGQA
jgi:hypothetical protein